MLKTASAISSRLPSGGIFLTDARRMSKPLEGKTGFVFGVANKRSIAWGIAQAWHEAGARLAFTYQGDRLKGNVEQLAAEFGDDTLITECDVSRDGDIDRVFAEVGDHFNGKLDMLLHSVAFAPREALEGRFVNTTREAFATALDISAYSLVALARGAEPLMADGGSIIGMSYYGAEKVVPHYNVMGVAKAALESATRYLANDLGPEGIRVNAISPGPMKTLAGAAIGGARKTYKHTDQNAPLRSNATLEAVGGTAVYLASDAGACTTGEVIRVDGGFHVLGMPQPDHL